MSSSMGDTITFTNASTPNRSEPASLQAGKVCVEHGKACLSARVNYRIDGGKFLEQSDHLVATRLESDTITIEYWGKDDAGNDVRVLRKLTVTGKEISVE